MADRYPAQKDYALLIMILLVGAYLRFDGLNTPGLWLDEVSYTTAAQRPILSQIIKSTETLGGYLSVDPTLSAVPFSLALKLGFSNFLARFPATVFGILAIPFFYKLGRTLFGNRAGLVAALLLSLSGFHILYSQEARSYTGLVLFSIVSYLYFYKAITEKNRSNWVVYALATWAGVSTSHLMLFTIASQGLGLTSIFFRDLWLSKSNPETIRAALRICSTFLLSLLVVGIFRSFWWEDFTQRQCFGCDVGNPSYPLDLINSFSRSLDAFTGSSPIIAAGQITLCLLGLSLAMYNLPKQGLLLASWLILSILATTIGLWLISQFYHERYTIWGLPAFLLAVAYGIISLANFTQRLVDRATASKKRIRVAQLAIVAFILIPLLVNNLDQVRRIPAIKQAWPLGQLQQASHKIAAEANSQETIIAIGMPAWLLQFYLDLNRPDLIYLDENSFTELQTHASLPAELRGRWYVFPSRAVSNIPDRWVDSLAYWQYNDIIMLHLDDPCSLAVCLDETKRLLTEISQANPNSPLAARISGVMTGLTLLLD